MQVVSCGNDDGYLGELRHAVDCAIAGIQPTLVTAEDGLSAIEICEAERKSVETGQPVKL